MHEKPRALDKALRSLALRPHSEGELVEKLTAAGYSEREIAGAMAKLAEYHFIDDSQFAAQWAAARARRGLGARRIAQELRHKGIARDISDEALASLDESVLLENATSLAAKHLRRGDSNARRRAYAALIRRGFDYSLANQALDRAAAEVEGEE